MLSLKEPASMLSSLDTLSTQIENHLSDLSIGKTTGKLLYSPISYSCKDSYQTQSTNSSLSHPHLSSALASLQILTSSDTENAKPN